MNVKGRGVGLLLFYLFKACLASENVKEASNSKNLTNHNYYIHYRPEPDYVFLEEDYDNYGENYAKFEPPNNSYVTKVEKPKRTLVEKSINEKILNKATPQDQQQPPQPFFTEPESYNIINRQFNSGIHMLRDMAMIGMLSMPILGLLQPGTSPVADMTELGFKLSLEKNRDLLKEAASSAVKYTETLLAAVERLERALDKYQLQKTGCMKSSKH